MKRHQNRLREIKGDGLKYFFTVCSPLISNWHPPKPPQFFYTLVISDLTCCVYKEKTSNGERVSSRSVILAEFQGETIFEYERSQLYSYGEFENLLQQILVGEYVVDPTGWVKFYSQNIKQLKR